MSGDNHNQADRPHVDNNDVANLRDLLDYETGGLPKADYAARVLLTAIDTPLCDLLARSLPTATLRTEMAAREARGEVSS